MVSYTLASMLAFAAAVRAAVISTAATPDPLAFGGKPPGFGYPPGFVPHGHFPPGTMESIRNMRDKIKHVVLICMENRSLDNLPSGQKLRGLDNPINNGPFCNPVNISDPSADSVCAAPGDYNSVQQDPDHSVTGFNMEYFGEFVPSNKAIADGKLKPTMQGFPTEQIRTHKGTNHSVLENQVMDYYTEAQVPVITEITNEFVVFNHWHGDCACPTNPNRVALTSGTTHGKGANNFNYGTMPQMSIFQQLTELGHTWKDYQQNQSIEDALCYEWTWATGNDKLVVDYYEEFHQDIENGTLPDFVYINPSCCGPHTTSMHPNGAVSDGDAFLKDVYESLRNSEYWEETSIIIVFDEGGGFHDHVAPPLALPPDNLTYTELTPAGDYTLTFNRLSQRLPTWLISPWVPKGYVEQ